MLTHERKINDICVFIYESKIYYALSDSETNSVIIFKDPQTKLLKTKYNKAYGKDFKNPTGLCFDPKGFLIIVDKGNQRIVRIKIPE